jgi:hypothetical protein
MQSHIEEAIRHGGDPKEARRAFGSMLRRREESRDLKVVAWLDSLRADAIFGWRCLAQGDLRRRDPVALANRCSFEFPGYLDGTARSCGAAITVPYIPSGSGQPWDIFRTGSQDRR